MVVQPIQGCTCTKQSCRLVMPTMSSFLSIYIKETIFVMNGLWSLLKEAKLTLGCLLVWRRKKGWKMTFLACCRADFLEEEGRSSSTSTSSAISSPRKSRRRNRRRFIRRTTMKANFTDNKMSMATVVKTLSLRTAARGLLFFFFYGPISYVRNIMLIYHHVYMCYLRLLLEE